MGQPTPGSWARGEGLYEKLSAPIEPIWWRLMGTDTIVTFAAVQEKPTGYRPGNYQL